MKRQRFERHRLPDWLLGFHPRGARESPAIEPDDHVACGIAVLRFENGRIPRGLSW